MDSKPAPSCNEAVIIQPKFAESSFSVSSGDSQYKRLKLFTRSDSPHLHPFTEGSLWSIGDYAEASTFEIIDKLSLAGQNSFKDIIETLLESDPEGTHRVQQSVAEQAIAEGKNKWISCLVEELLTEFNTDVKTGLSNEQVLINREKYGSNVLEKEQTKPLWRIFIEQFLNVVVILLIITAITSFALGEWPAGVVIISILLINASLETYTEKSANEALAKLASLAAPKCNVLRNGEIVEIPAIDLVPGDIIKLATGDVVPADLRIVEIAELKANEAILTGLIIVDGVV